MIATVAAEAKVLAGAIPVAIDTTITIGFFFIYYIYIKEIIILNNKNQEKCQHQETNAMSVENMDIGLLNVKKG